MVEVYLYSKQKQLTSDVQAACHERQVVLNAFTSQTELIEALKNLESSHHRPVIIHEAPDSLSLKDLGVDKSCMLHISSEISSHESSDSHYHMSLKSEDWHPTSCSLYLDLALSQARVDQIQVELEQLKENYHQLQLTRDYYIHENRNALSILEGKCGQLIRALTTPAQNDPWVLELKDKVQGLAGVSKRLIGLVDDLYEGKVLAQGERAPEKEPGPTHKCDAKTLLESAIMEVKPELSSRLNLQLQCPEDLKINAHQDRLIQVFENLIKNANRATLNHKDPWIKIIVERNKSSVLILFVDSGLGILEPERIFEDYYTTKSEPENSGLGLKICRNYLSQMNAKIYYRLYDFKNTCLVIEFLDQH